MHGTEIELLIILLLILINGFFAGTEIAVISTRRTQLNNLISQGSKRAKQVADLLKEPDRFLATIQVGVTVAGTTASVLAGSWIVPGFVQYLEKTGMKAQTAQSVAVVIVVAAASYLLLVIGELVPKYLAFNSPERMALSSAPVLTVFAKIAHLPARLLSLSARAILLPFGLLENKSDSYMSEDEINLILAEGHKKGHFEQAERDLIEGVFEFADTTVRQAMTPRTDICGVDLTDSQEEVLRKITEEGYSRYPVYADSLDNIKGVVHTKDVTNLLVHSELIILQDIIRPVSFVPDSKMVHTQLHDFQKSHEHMAIVLDEFGGTAGLITMEDILEEIVGEIRDEHDTEMEPFILINSRLCQVQAQFPIENFNKEFEVELDEEGSVDTIGGYVLNHLGAFPRLGERIAIDNLQFEIVTMDGPRIERMRVRKLERKRERD
jgi:putative hemolysin